MLRRLLLFILSYSFTGIAMSQTEKQEANLKAVFIYNFTKYIDWDASSSPENTFVIGIIGSSAIMRPLTEIAKENKVNNKKIIIRSFSKPEDIGECQILFIPKKSPLSLSSILDKCGRGVLTISEEEGFAKRGTAFNFVVINDKLKFETNLKALDLAGLKAGSQLLKLAIVID
jgi:hypothetical protein